MNKKDYQLAGQACINSYEGKYGEVVEIFETWEKHVVRNVEFYFGVICGIGHIIVRGSDRSTEGQKGLKSWFKRFLFSWKDWFQNLDTHSIDVKEGKMHLGIYEDHIKIFALCREFVTKYKTNILIGHSKGAMQALALYFFLKDVYKNIKFRCIAEAPAKTFSKKLKKYFPEDEVVTIINGEDFITKLPQWKFSHVGKIVRIGKRNIFMNIPFVRAVAVMDHYPNKYLDNINKL